MCNAPVNLRVTNSYHNILSCSVAFLDGLSMGSDFLATFQTYEPHLSQLRRSQNFPLPQPKPEMQNANPLKVHIPSHMSTLEATALSRSLYDAT